MAGERNSISCCRDTFQTPLGSSRRCSMQVQQSKKIMIVDEVQDLVATLLVRLGGVYAKPVKGNEGSTAT